MTLSIRPLQPFCGEVSGVELRVPLDRSDIAAIHAGMNRHAVLIFHDQSLTPEQQRTRTQQFGQLELGFARVVARHRTGGAAVRTGYEDVADMSDLDAAVHLVARTHSKIVGNIANQLWHSDSSFQQPTARYSLLYAVKIPTWGGETEFCDLRAAYDGLHERTNAELQGL